ncbi:MAG: integration host factor subunit alpha [Candidatus Puniceispirillales bacterium]|tara:strand:- start:185 stop:478 length:294 start_codon:yes stop_codon:yes gene_type:complete
MVSTLTRSDIADELYNTIGLSHNESSEIVELFFEEILQCFEKGEEVKLTSFGTFKIREKKERIGRNPKTGVEAKISSRKVVTFKPSSYIKEKITKEK